MQLLLYKQLHAKHPNLRWEIGIALFIKFVLLFGLWWLIFRWLDKPVQQPDIVAHFALSTAPVLSAKDSSSQSNKEVSHVR